MNIDRIADYIRNFEGVRRKNSIAESIKSLEETLNLGVAKVIKSFGEDAAFIEVPNIKNEYILLAMDGMWDKLVQADPYIAGYFSILVNVDDIVVKGGTPIALLDTLSSTDSMYTNKMIDGIVAGCKKFSVPMVGGHYHPDTNYNTLSVAILGIVEKNSALFSDSANVGDAICIAIDMDGSFNTKFKYAFNSTQHKTPAQIQQIFNSWRQVTSNKLATAGKDISNPGILGTLGMLLDASEKGGHVRIPNIPIPKNIELEMWLKAYPGYGIIFTANTNDVYKISRLFSETTVIIKEIGEVDDSRKLIIEDETSSVELFDFSKTNLSGMSHH
ncbi:MAG: AIR synthase related protein [Candidatus Helarchaeota archaeon]